MVLQIYAGSLTEFFAAALKLAVPDVEWTDVRVRERVVLWRSQISAGLEAQGHLRETLDWDESPGPATRLELPEDSLRALKLLSLYAEQTAASLPEFLPGDAELDPLWLRASDADFADNRYAQILAPAFWLPGSFSLTFRCPYPDGHEVESGSTGSLLAELDQLGQQNFYDEGPVDPTWCVRPGPGATLYELARHAWALLTNQCRSACERRVPLLFES